MTRAIFYTHQTRGACAGVCACDRTHQMEKAVACPILLASQIAWICKRKYIKKLLTQASLSYSFFIIDKLIVKVFCMFPQVGLISSYLYCFFMYWLRPRLYFGYNFLISWIIENLDEGPTRNIYLFRICIGLFFYF